MNPDELKVLKLKIEIERRQKGVDILRRRLAALIVRLNATVKFSGPQQK